LSALNGKALLCTEEIDRNLQDRKAKILVCTWNMGGVNSPPQNLTSFILIGSLELPDILIIGVQEFNLNK
jgi:hypothetical protein